MSKPMYVWNGSTWEEVGPVVPQTPIAYQASAPSSPSTGDIWVDSDGDVGTFDRQLVRYRFVASGGETSLSGVDANGFTLAYVPGAEQVYLNGVLLVRTSDYTATNGTSITALSPALAANDVVEVFAYNSFNLANTYTKAEVDGSLDLKTDVSANGLVYINTTSGTSITSLVIDDCFSATYDNYIIYVNCTGSTNTPTLRFRWRDSGGDITASNYDWAITYSTTSAGPSRNSNTNQPQLGLAQGAVAAGNQGTLFAYPTSGSLVWQFHAVNQINNAFSSMDSGATITGFNVYTATPGGDFSGSVAVYGVKK